MNLSKEAIEELRQIWKEEFGEEISCEHAEMRGKEIIRLFKVIYRPLPDHHPDVYREKRKEDLLNKATLTKEEKPPQGSGVHKRQLKLL